MSDLDDKLFQRYLLEKFVPMLEHDLFFRRYAPVLPPQPWHRRLRWKLRWYIANVWNALKGQDPYDE